MDAREAKGREIADRMLILPEGDDWSVPSQQTGGGRYVVSLNPDALSCTCEDFILRQKPCKHIHAARIRLERIDGKLPESSEPPSSETPNRKRPTYKQPNWPAYHESQVREKEKFLI